jgi:hypothetical protein
MSDPRPILLALALVAAGLPAQRVVKQVTTSTEQHQDAKLSPDGSTVAFRAIGKLMVVSYTGGAEFLLVSSAGIADFFWNSTSTGLYYLDGTVVSFVNKGGGTPTTIRALPGVQHRIWCLTKDDKTIYGTRFDGATTKYSIFTLATSGTSAPVDIVQSLYTVDNVRLDPANAKIAYREFDRNQPNGPREFWLAGANGSNPVSLTGGQIFGQIDVPEFTDNGITVVFTSVATTTPTFQISKLVNGNTTIQYLTESPGLSRRTSVSPNQKWIAHEAATAGQSRFAVIPADGGGRIVLDPQKVFVFASSASFDATGTKIVFSGVEAGQGAINQVFSADLDNELRIYPRLEIGKLFFADLPLGSYNLAGFFIAAALAASPITIPSISYPYELDLATSIALASGPGTGGVLSLPIPLPNNASMVGQSLYWQGARVSTTTLTGELTRPASTRIF